MKLSKLTIGILTLLQLTILTAKAGEEKKVNVFDAVVFYDGYRQEVVDAALDDGVLRFRNSLYSKKLDMEELADLGDNLCMNVTIGALCDNYDRIGNVDLAFVPKGSESYVYGDVKRIELTRFITPFMNKNKNPREVPYEYDISNVTRILRDADMTEAYDFWLEMEVFGVPYAANQQIAGCKDRNDVFEGTIDLVYTPAERPEKSSGNVLVPIYVKYPEDYGNINFNNYTEGATDTLGVTTRTFEFEIPESVSDSKIYLILTNHGAGNNGEEYVRRLHLVYYDGNIELSYTPGGVSCEPYRVYNTQANGIYGTSRTERSWQSSSNWCPGQAVPTREIPLGAQEAGIHKVMIRVPNARFYGKDGDFRPSLYFQGVKEGEMPAGIYETWFEGPAISLVQEGETLRYHTSEDIAAVLVHTYDGRTVDVFGNPSGSIDLSGCPKGMLILTFVTPEGQTTAKPWLNR